MTNWTETLSRIAEDLAGKSKDPSTRVGAVVFSTEKFMLAAGFNGIPIGVHDKPERYERPEKYQWVAHAEENAIASAARYGHRLVGATMLVTHYPCARCAGLIIQAGITRVIHMGGKTSMPAEEFECAAVKFSEAGVLVQSVNEARL